MKLDYCNDHVRKGEKIEACLAIRHDDGKAAKPRDIWAEIERLQTALEKIISDGDYTSPGGMTRIARDALKVSSDLGNRRDAGPIGGASELTDGLAGKRTE